MKRAIFTHKLTSHGNTGADHALAAGGFARSLVLWGLVSMSLLGWANTAAAVSDLEIMVKRSQVTCSELNCPETRIGVRELRGEELQALPPSHREFLDQSTLTFAEEIWPDTVLEGPFEVDYSQPAQIEKVEALMIDGEIQGYRVTFSMTARDIDREVAGRVVDRLFAIPQIPVHFHDDAFTPSFR